jgi:hypothetical protein
MPYFITVLALVVIGVGFTLFNQQEEVVSTTTETTPTEIVSAEETPPVAPPLPTDTPLEIIPETPTEATPQPTLAAPSNPLEVVSPTTIPSSTFADGSYSSSLSYRTPEGMYEMTVGVTIKQDMVMATTLTFNEEGAQSGYSKRFTNAYKESVMGKDLEEVSLSRVGGASLTTKAFNTALSDIRAQAS